jgi:hypothetical protein
MDLTQIFVTWQLGNLASNGKHESYKGIQAYKVNQKRIASLLVIKWDWVSGSMISNLQKNLKNFAKRNT